MTWEMVRVEVEPGATTTGVNEADAPGGKPLTLNATGPLNPPNEPTAIK